MSFIAAAPSPFTYILRKVYLCKALHFNNLYRIILTINTSKRGEETVEEQDMSYTEFLDCLEDAKCGRLSPYWQAYAMRELDQLRNIDGTLPPKAEALAQELCCVLVCTAQISDEESTRRETIAQGNELVYTYYGSSYGHSADCFMNIIYVPSKDVYTASFSLARRPKDQLCGAIKAMQENLLRWWRTQKDFSPLPCLWPVVAQEYYATKREAVRFLLGCLNKAAADSTGDPHKNAIHL
jgi:hypothetical protein